jgi:ParB family chromosome partitioning protein
MAEKTELLEEDEKVVEIELERLRGFENHPFKVRADSQMIELQESIRKYGILNPLIVRPKKDGCYEIISGHRRKFATEKIGYRKVPVIIRVLKDDEAVVSMVDSNLQREMISPSEKAFAYKMKYEAIKRKAGRRKCGQVDHNLGKKSIELIGEECGDSPKQVHRYIKITDLIPEMLEKVDDGSMEFTPAVQLSYLKANEQKQMLDAMEFAQYVPDIAENWQAQQMIATLIHDMPEAQIEGEISENIQKKIDWIESRDKRADELHQITDKLEKGVKDVFQSDKYKQFLNVMAKFPRYVRQVREWRQQN